MRASVYPVFLTILLLVARPVSAEPTLTIAQSQAAAAIAAAQLAQAAAAEAQRLQQVGDDAQRTGSISKSQKSDRKSADGSARKSARTKKLRAKLLEAERLRIRNKYRAQQKQRIAARLPADHEPSIDTTTQSTAVGDAD